VCVVVVVVVVVVLVVVLLCHFVFCLLVFETGPHYVA
jgi:hypothetical protein